MSDTGISLATIFEGSGDAIIGKDMNGLVTSWNSAAEALLGYAADEMIGRSIAAIIPTDRANEEAAILDRIRSGEKVPCFETSRWHKDGTSIAVSIAVSPIRDRQQKIIGVFEIARDRGEALFVHRELMQCQALLREAHKMAAIGRLTTGVAHDFNNILQSIINALELVLDEVAEDTPARKFTDIAIKAAVRGSSLTDHVISYAREQSLRPKTIELGPFLHDIEDLLARTLGPQIEIVIRLIGSPATLTDPGQLQTALLNLAINASHAMPLGGTLTMQASEEFEDGEHWAVVAFTDTGAGMNAPNLARAVEPFFTNKGGSGLGLPMVQSFAEQAGGKMRIAGLPGQGTTIRLWMPSTVTAHRAISHAPSAVPRAQCRILLVDDLTDVLFTLTALLAKAGFDVTPADSGSQALSILGADSAFDLLITDFAMPGINGADLITRCRLVHPGLLAIVITGFADLRFVETLPKGTDVLRKPIQRNDLVETVHRLMKRDQDEKLVSYASRQLPGIGKSGPVRAVDRNRRPSS